MVKQAQNKTPSYMAEADAMIRRQQQEEQLRLVRAQLQQIEARKQSERVEQHRREQAEWEAHKAQQQQAQQARLWAQQQ